MESCLRGFSFMPEKKAEIMNLQYIEEGELERTWKTSRRERVKQREQKIWEEFVNENDIVNTICKDDQYQFLDELPEACLKEIMEKELQKLRKEIKAEAEELASPEQVDPDIFNEDTPHTCVVKFAEDVVKDACDMFHIFDDDKDDLSGLEDGMNDSLTSPSTVRERQIDMSEGITPDRPSSGITSSTGKSSENVTNVIESSIYCAKVKDLRLKINEEILGMMTTLDRRDIFSMEQEDISRMIKRCSEFCTRFNRIYMYQLQRQMHDIKRNNSLTLPFAKHTQFQSQMVRIVSLHQNLLQSIQVFRKSVEQSWCVREGIAGLRALVEATRSATHHCAAVTQPKDLVAAHHLYNDTLLASCDKLDEFTVGYTARCEEFLKGFPSMAERPSKRSPKSKSRKRPIPNGRNNSKINSETASRLSMYSLDTLRMNTRTASSKDMQSLATLRSRASLHGPNNNSKTDQAQKKDSPRTGKRKSPNRSHRPLMRDPHAGKPKAPKAVRDHDIKTMVEAVKECTSSHVSLEPSQHKAHTPRTPRTPRKDAHAVKKPQPNTPRRHGIQSPKAQAQNIKPLNLKPILSCIQTVTQELTSARLSPLCKMQFPKKSPGKQEEKETEKKVEEENNKVPVSPKPTRTESSNTVLLQVESPKTPVVDSPKASSLTSESPRPSKSHEGEEKKTRDRNKVARSPDQCEVTRLLKQLCSGDTTPGRTERTTGAKNAQLLHVSGNSPRSQPSTPQLLRILEETIQKKVPKTLYKMLGTRDVDKYRLTFNIAENVADNLFQYRTRFVQHMLASPMYANSAVGKPWEMIGSVSEQIIDEVLLNCVKEIEIKDVLLDLYWRETT